MKDGFPSWCPDGCQLEQIMKILLGVSSISKRTHVCGPPFGLSRILNVNPSFFFPGKEKDMSILISVDEGGHGFYFLHN